VWLTYNQKQKHEKKKLKKINVSAQQKLLFYTECAGEKKFEIGQYLAKIWTEVCGLIFATLCI